VVEYVHIFTTEYYVFQSLSKTTLLISVVLLFFDSFISTPKKIHIQEFDVQVNCIVKNSYNKTNYMH